MTVGAYSPLMGYIRRMACAGVADGATDRQLLEQYLVAENEAAFAALVRRHGPMVHGVCLRVLGNVHDADDAFQAVFLVLMRKAHKIVKFESVGSWLHGVAYRIALRARSSASRRREVEKRAPVVAMVHDDDGHIWEELRPILDQEIAGLPEKYRLPFVLCYLEGKTNTQAAKQLRWPLGTVATNLARARQRLRKRLTWRGAGLAAGLMAATESRTAFAASASQRLGFSVLNAVLKGTSSGRAAALAKGVSVMWMSKLQIMAMILVASVVSAGGVGFLVRGNATIESRTEAQTPPPAQNIPPIVGDAKKEPGPLAAAPQSAPKAPKQFMIKCKISKIGPDGEESVIARPKITTLDGRSAEFLGSEVPNTSSVGVNCKFTVSGRKDGRLRVEHDFVLTIAKHVGNNMLLTNGAHATSVNVCQQGDLAQIELFGPETGQYRVVFSVIEIELPLR